MRHMHALKTLYECLFLIAMSYKK